MNPLLLPFLQPAKVILYFNTLPNLRLLWVSLVVNKVDKDHIFCATKEAIPRVISAPFIILLLNEKILATHDHIYKYTFDYENAMATIYRDNETEPLIIDFDDNWMTLNEDIQQIPPQKPFLEPFTAWLRNQAKYNWKGDKCNFEDLVFFYLLKQDYP